MQDIYFQDAEKLDEELMLKHLQKMQELYVYHLRRLNFLQQTMQQYSIQPDELELHIQDVEIDEYASKEEMHDQFQCMRENVKELER
jgi:hypothetical protein